MPIPSAFHVQLKQRQEQHAAEAMRLLLEEDDADGAAKALQRIRTGNELLKLCGPPPTVRRRLSSSLVFGLICVVVVSLLWICPKGNPLVHLDLKASTAELRLATRKDFSWQPDLATNELILDQAAFVLEAIGLGLNQTCERMELDGRGIKLKRLEVSGGARLEVERSLDGISLGVFQGRMWGEIELKEGKLRVDSSMPSDVASKIPPETILFRSMDPNGGRLRLKVDKDFRLDGLQVSGMVFKQEKPLRSGVFVSTVLGGTVSLPEVESKEAIEEGDWLRLDEAVSRRLFLDFSAASKDSFVLGFQGRANSLSVGPEDFERKLNPSWLVWMYHRRELSFFWGAIVFSYGLLSGLRGLLKE